MAATAPSNPAEFPDDKSGWARRWTTEFDAARKFVEKWHTEAKEANKFYLNEKDDSAGERLTLFSSGVNTRLAMLYGKTPQIDVDRRFNDVDDDTARVGSEILQRGLNSDVERSDDGYALALECAIGDYLRVGMPMTRLRYVRETEPTDVVPATDMAPEVPAGERVTREDVETDYIYWEDHLWSPARVFQQVRWWSFENELTDEALKVQFGEDVAAQVAASMRKREDADGDALSPWARTSVWEIWDKEHECVWWFVEGHDEVLVPLDAAPAANPNGSVPDPLGVKGFWPFPRPLMSNATTSNYLPKPDFKLAADLYKSINETTTRIGLLRDALRAAGVYDGSEGNEAIGRLLKGKGNQLFPVKNWFALTEKGGVQGCVLWLPLDSIVAALEKLRELRNEDINLAYQVSGDSDIMRGQASAAGATATEQAIKAKYASVRMQRTQDEVARYASDIQRIRSEIMSKLFSDESLLARANVKWMAQADQMLVQPAMQLIRDEFACYRITVKPEAISLTDYAALKQERTEIIAAIAGYLQVAGPLAQTSPAIAPFLLQILQWMVAGLKGGSSLESVLDQAIKAAQQAAAAPQAQQSDPKLEAAKVKADAEKFKAGADVQATQLDMKHDVLSHQLDMQKLEAQQRAEGMKALTGVLTKGGAANDGGHA